jgi:hypothetical protein
VEVTTDTDLLLLDFAGPEALGRTAQRVVDRVIETLHVVRVEPDFRRKERRIQGDFLVARRTVEPREVAEGERGQLVDRRRAGRRGLGSGRRRALWSTGTRFQCCQFCFELLDACLE